MIPGANPLQYSAAYAQMLGLAGFTQQQQNLAQVGSEYLAQTAKEILAFEEKIAMKNRKTGHGLQHAGA